MTMLRNFSPNRTLSPLPGVLLLAAIACGDEATPRQTFEIISDAPAARPENSPICLNVLPFPVAGELRRRGLIIRNLGRQTLRVASMRVVSQNRPGAFSVVGVVDNDNRPCEDGAECQVSSGDTVQAAFDVQPPARGWDHAVLGINTNDPDQQELRVAVVSVAKDPGESDVFDPGPRPEAIECTCRAPLPEECNQ
ncbi:MAG: hypothetical protein HC923_06000 [Myxococcales bacterium]|nr:hypothetical protein [Myxococcales bacterium]